MKQTVLSVRLSIEENFLFFNEKSEPDNFFFINLANFLVFMIKILIFKHLIIFQNVTFFCYFTYCQPIFIKNKPMPRLTHPT